MLKKRANAKVDSGAIKSFYYCFFREANDVTLTVLTSLSEVISWNALRSIMIRWT